MHDSLPNRIIPLAEDDRYIVRLASTTDEIESALRLRHDVFIKELGAGRSQPSGRESDGHDLECEHLIVVERATGNTVGTYRMRSVDAKEGISGFYSNTEFSIETLPTDVLAGGIEVGRACVAAEHRTTRAIFLLWKALARRMKETGKRYFFGCCSIFTQNPADGAAVYSRLKRDGLIHDRYCVEPRRAIAEADRAASDVSRIKLPGLFEMYLRVGARVCGRPTYDVDFGTVDFFVVFDLEAMEPKYRRLFLN